MDSAAHAPFKFARDTYAVRVDNIAACVGRHELIELFSNLIGHVRKCDENITDEHGRYMDISFFSRDASRKALCMSGYTVAGVPLSVCALAPPRNHNYASRVNGSDDRRNLYVLGLPFNLTKTEFTELFSRNGTVMHSVILATVDNASRRRGFVVMSTHAEAKAAMDSLSRAEIKGHVIDVSWAVVQRSQGFLDGGDRTLGISQREGMSPTMGPASTTGSATPPHLSHGLSRTYPLQPPGIPLSAHSSSSSLPALSSSSTFCSSASGTSFTHGAYAASAGAPTRPSSSAGAHGELEEHHVTRLVTQEPTPVLLIRDLPLLLFSSDQDLHPLFWPFGEVKRLERLKSSRSADSAGALAPTTTAGRGALSAASPNVGGEPGADDAKVEDAKRPDSTVTSEKLSIVVEYATIANACEARQSLHGQAYGAYTVCADFVELPARSPTYVPGSRTMHAGLHSSSSSSSSIGSVGIGMGVNRDLGAMGVGMHGQAYHKRHSMTTLGPMVDVTPSSPPRSAKSLGGFAYDREAEYDALRSAYNRGYDAPPHAYDRSGAYDDGFEHGGYVDRGGFAAEYEREKQRQREYERERELTRRAMYDRSNNTSPFHGMRNFLAPHGMHAQAAMPGVNHGYSGAAAHQGGPAVYAGGGGENRFGAIARPLSSSARFPPEAPMNAGPRPGGVARSKFDELMYAEYPPTGLRRDNRLFQSMPDVFEFASNTPGTHA